MSGFFHRLRLTPGEHPCGPALGDTKAFHPGGAEALDISATHLAAVVNHQADVREFLREMVQWRSAMSQRAACERV
jgi:hypothetical protein